MFGKFIDRIHIRSIYSFLSRRIGLLSVTLVAGIMAGCAGPELLRDSEDYTDYYATASNKQLLLNLARLRNDDPPYFLQVSSITSSDQMSSTGGFNASNANELHTMNGAPLGTSAWTLGGSLSGTVAQNPTFTFVPLNGDAFSQAITVPMPASLFFGLVKQEHPADLVARIMISSINIPCKRFKGTAQLSWDAKGNPQVVKDASGKEAVNDLEKTISYQMLDPVTDTLVNCPDAGKSTGEPDPKSIAGAGAGTGGDDDTSKGGVKFVQDKKGNFLNEKGVAVLSSKGLPLVDKDFHPLYDNWGKLINPGAEIQEHPWIAVYTSSTYALINDPSLLKSKNQEVRDHYINFLVYCYHLRLLQLKNILTVQSSPAATSVVRQDKGSDDLYPIDKLKLSDIVAAKTAGYSVIPYRDPDKSNDLPTSNLYFVSKTTTGTTTGSNETFGKLPVDQSVVAKKPVSDDDSADPKVVTSAEDAKALGAKVNFVGKFLCLMSQTTYVDQLGQPKVEQVVDTFQQKVAEYKKAFDINPLDPSLPGLIQSVQDNVAPFDAAVKDYVSGAVDTSTVTSQLLQSQQALTAPPQPTKTPPKGDQQIQQKGEQREVPTMDTDAIIARMKLQIDQLDGAVSNAQTLVNAKPAQEAEEKQQAQQVQVNAFDNALAAVTAKMEDVEPLGNTSALNMRTFVGILRQVSKEEIYKDDFTDVLKGIKGLDGASPLLTLVLPADHDNYDVLVAQNYNDQTYYIADKSQDYNDGPDESPKNEKVTIRAAKSNHSSANDTKKNLVLGDSNKKVFDILTQLYADITLDPQKLPQPIQVISQ